MSWFKIDDNFHAHPKVKSIPRRDRAAVIGLWTMAGSWCSQQLTDGHVPAYMLDEFGASPKLAAALVAARSTPEGSGLWVVNEEKGGWDFHDWHTHQPSRETVQAKRKQSADRIAAWRAAKKGDRNGGVTALQDESNDVTDEFGNAGETLTPTRPDPTRPDPTSLPTEEREKNSSNRRHAYPADFLAFWEKYPKKVGKDAALKGWKSALNRATLDEIVTGAERYANDPKRDPKFTKDPQGWLSGGHWADEPEQPKVDPYRQFRMLG